jgi:GNAT superfamily N-acetyltransferase
MKLICRPYEPDSDDFLRLCRFVIQDNRVKKEYFVFQLGRIVDWKYGLWRQEKYFPSFFRRNAQLWFDPFDQLAGFAISENGDGQFVIFVTDSYAPQYAAILEWVLVHWRGRPGGLSTELTEIQTGPARALEQFGFVSQGISEVTRMYDLAGSAESAVEPPVGFELVDRVTRDDPLGLARLKANAFRGQDAVSELDLLAHAYVRESPIYKPEFDLSLITPDGRYAAGCEAFIDYENQVAEVERVCVHSDFRRRGLAKAVIQACFQRLRDHGIPTAFITGMSEEAISLYGRLAAVKAVNRVTYQVPQE